MDTTQQNLTPNVDPPVSGLVEYVQVHPARKNFLRVMASGQATAHSFSIADDAEVTCDGARVDVPQLFDWLLNCNCYVRVTLHPTPVYYGLSIKTDFKTVGA